MVELIGAIELQKYMGEWFEMARKPAFFQNSCVQAKAKYTLANDGKTLEITNFCAKKDGKESITQGKAKVKGPRELAVKFSVFMNPFDSTNYEIIYLDTKYQVAIVGSPDKKYLWILAREILPQENVKNLLEIAKSRGFDIGDVILGSY